ncbi:unnamed protein product, partial [Oppiella nova]
MASMIALLIGIYQLLFGIFRMGFVSVYMSEQLISSFITASSFYVLTSQIGYMSGLHLHSHSGPLSLFHTYKEFFGSISMANTISLLVSLICIAILLLFKLYLNDKLKQWTKLNIPFPIELVLVVGSTVMTSFFKPDIETVGAIATGLPSPISPEWSLLPKLWLRCIPLAIVAYAITYSTGKTFATKHNYEINSNQELLAIGTTNIFSSFFSCLPTAASLSRSAVQEAVGGRTQMASIVNSAGILFVLLFFGQYLENLPNCVLAAIICVALKTLFAQIFDVYRYCRVNKLDGSIWIVTFLAVIILNVDIGLYVGLAYSLITLIYKSQRPKTYLLGSIDKSDVYVPLKKYASAHEVNAIKIYQFCGPLHFANCVLAAIICVALKTLFAQIFDVYRYCRVNKLDGSIWIVTFLAVIILNVDIGLYVGLAYSLITLIYKSQRPKTYLLGSIDKSDVYVPLKKYASAHEVNAIKIYQFCGPLHFANVEYFKK